MAREAGDTKLFMVTVTKRDREELQKGLSKLSELVVEWQRQFNLNNCKVMHIGAKKYLNFTRMLMESELARF